MQDKACTECGDPLPQDVINRGVDICEYCWFHQKLEQEEREAKEQK